MQIRRRSTLLGADPLREREDADQRQPLSLPCWWNVRADLSLCCCLALAAVLATGPCSGLEAANTIAVGVGEGSPGDSDVHVVVTAANDVSVHGYSIAFAYPVEVLELTRISTNGTSVQSLEPDFVGSAFDNQLGVGSMGVILTLSQTAAVKELPPVPAGGGARIIARLTFDVKADAAGGLYPLRLLDGIGNPAQFNRFTNAGHSVRPELIDGQFVVAGLSNTLLIDKKIAFPGATPNLRLTAYTQHDDPLDGFQVAFTYEKGALGFVDATYTGTALDAELGRRNLIELFNVDHNPTFTNDRERVTVASLFDAAPPLDGQQLSPNPVDPLKQSLVHYTFNVLPAADDTRQWQDLVMDDLGTPGLLGSRLIFGPRGVVPNLVHGKVYFSTGDLSGQVVDAGTGEAVSGVSVTTDPDGFAATTNASGTYRLSEIPPGAYTLRFSDRRFYSGRLEGAIVAGRGEASSAGTVRLFRLPPAVQQPFVRGFLNEDARMDLSDIIFILTFLFQGGSAPACMAAADINDDNAVDIADSIAILAFLFSGGPPPAPPYTSDKTGCALDPTPGAAPLSCEEFTCAGEG